MQIKACVDATDCQPDFCLDLYEPSGHGRRRRRRHLAGGDANATEYTKFKENIEYTVTVPGEYDELRFAESDQCRHFVIISILLSALLALSTILVSSLEASDLHILRIQIILKISLDMCVGV